MMSIFVQTDAGYVNCDHVIRVTVRRDRQRGGVVQTLWFSNGETKEISDPVDWERISAPVIPAAAGAEVMLVTVYDDEPEIAVEAERVPVVGWRIHPWNGLSPVLLDSAADNQRILFLLSGGKLTEPGFMEYESLDQALRLIKGQAEDCRRRRVEAVIEATAEKK